MGHGLVPEVGRRCALGRCSGSLALHGRTQLRPPQRAAIQPASCLARQPTDPQEAAIERERAALAARQQDEKRFAKDAEAAQVGWLVADVCV